MVDRMFASVMALMMVALLVGACAQPISSNPFQDAAASLPKGGQFDIEAGLKEAAYNLDGAIRVGINDPRIVAASGCVHGVMQQLGIDAGQTPAPSFTPEVHTLLGQGSVFYIRAVQVAGAAGQGIMVPASCKEQIGQMVLDAAAANKNVLPGGGLLPTFK